MDENSESLQTEDVMPDPEEQEAEAASNAPDFLEMTIQSCVLPLEMRFSQINGTYVVAPRAYRTYLYINSVIEGVIPPERYSFAADQTDRGVRLTKWNIGEAIAAVRKFDEAGRKVEFVTARVSPKIVYELDFYGYVKEILDEYGFDEPEKLCLEFPRTVLYEDSEKVRMALLSLKLLKVKSLLSGFGDRECPATPIFDLPFDYVLLSPWLAGFIDDRGKHEAFESLIALIHNNGCQLIVDGVKTDNQIKVLSRQDVYGYIPSPGYSGDREHGRLRMTLDEALLQSDEEEEGYDVG